jgi:hypothetical protein
MLRIQYEENERRQDIGPLERGRWFARVQSEFGYTISELARDFGLSKGTISDYLAMTRLPEELVACLSDPRAISLNRGRRLMAALANHGEAALQRSIGAVQELRVRGAGDDGRPDPNDEFEAILRAAEGKSPSRLPGMPGLTKRVVKSGDGSPIGTITRSGNQWVLRFAASVDEAAIEVVAKKLPDLLSVANARKRRDVSGQEKESDASDLRD